MNAYIRKVFPHDEDHEVSLTADIFARFFESQQTMNFVNANGDEGAVTVNNATDLRFGGDFRRLCGEIHRNDFIVIVKRRTDYKLSVVRQGNDGYVFCGTLYEQAADRHAVISLENTFPPDDIEVEVNAASEENHDQEAPELVENIDLFQIIYYGAPGTGKSNKIENDLFKDADGGRYGLSSIDKRRKFRTTFHPDYDYAQFVGTYKPRAFQVGSQHEEETAEGVQNVANQNKTEITYEFVPQLFAKAYVKAWTEYLKVHAAPNAEKVYLVIEEINRGNCAQIFGDIFQLLDRKEGHSDYPIDVDSDFASYIKEQLSNVKQSEDAIANYWNDYKNKIQEWDSSEQGEERADDDFCKIALPPNLNILATMNTSDQSLFPMDSAFKRRFDWEYVPIDYDHPNADFDIEVGDKKYKWLDFLEKVNKNVFKVTKSEDKQMGEFFIKHSVDYKEFRSKVLFYLWDSVYKDEEGNKDAEKVFHFKLEGNQDKTLTFQTLFEGSEVDQKDRIAKIMSNLDVVDQNAPPPPQQGEQGANAAAAEPAPAEEPNPAQ
ncbi:AAA family ATPase [Fibrobacter sp. UWB7]|uniref:AAA family ATPase n=1 Tax=Fibrobacter sp. UWB7 TaxID=1896206 RepID=UPI000914ABB0|nr:AAA family ATPase [Fibrobacter sp. UWB7]SHM17574.1 AAA domain (dynein-related subfamily) [Fibrobacter sp. UWB7]